MKNATYEKNTVRLENNAIQQQQTTTMTKKTSTCGDKLMTDRVKEKTKRRWHAPTSCPNLNENECVNNSIQNSVFGAIIYWSSFLIHSFHSHSWVDIGFIDFCQAFYHLYKSYKLHFGVGVNGFFGHPYDRRTQILLIMRWIRMSYTSKSPHYTDYECCVYVATRAHKKHPQIYSNRLQQRLINRTVYPTGWHYSFRVLPITYRTCINSKSITDSGVKSTLTISSHTYKWFEEELLEHTSWDGLWVEWSISVLVNVNDFGWVVNNMKCSET